MSTLPRPAIPAWNTEYLRVAILTKDKGAPRKVAWITTGPGGIFIGVARATGWGTKYSYNTDGSFYRSIQSQAQKGPKESQELVAKHPPIPQVKGLLQLLTVEIGAGDRLRGFPFKRRYESVYIKPLNGKVSFKLGLLEPGVPQALDTIRRKEERHFRLIAKTEPWILLWNAAGFETATHQ
ncbi:MAG: hypothetical protein ABSG45_02655 [Nitrososphaerales archaeon]|jgi:hypothetical protein